MHIVSALQSVLVHRRLPLLLAVLAVGLCAPSLWSGLAMDDYAHRLKLLGGGRFAGVIGTSWDMFDFMDGDAERNLRMMDLGTMPWWTYPNILAKFWRPITTATHKLDYLLWPDSVMAMHAQSLAWLAALVFAAAKFYRRILGVTWAAGLAALLYAIDDSHAAPAGWIANRNALVAAVFGVVSLIWHDAWRRDGKRLGAVLGPVLLGASLLSNEAGIAAVGLLIAYAVALDGDEIRGRALSLVPYALVVAAWRVVWVLKGCGLEGVGLYIDPASEPLRFAAGLLVRAPLLLFGQFAFPPPDLVVFFGHSVVHAAAVVAWVALVGLAWALAPCVRRDLVSKFFALGTVLSVIPLCATFPSDRLLSLVGVGAMGLIARFVQIAGECDGASGSPSGRWGTGAVVWILVAIHLVIAPALLAIRSFAPVGPKWFHEQLHVATPFDGSVEQQDAVIVSAPSLFHTLFLPVIRELEGRPVPRRTRTLAPGAYGLKIRRPDAQTLVIRPVRPYLSWPLHRLFRERTHPFAVGDRVELTGMSVEILALSEAGDPAEAAFRFDVPLEDPSLRWLAFRDGAFETFEPPAIGSKIELAPAVPKLW